MDQVYDIDQSDTERYALTRSTKQALWSHSLNITINLPNTNISCRVQLIPKSAQDIAEAALDSGIVILKLLQTTPYKFSLKENWFTY